MIVILSQPASGKDVGAALLRYDLLQFCWKSIFCSQGMMNIGKQNGKDRDAEKSLGAEPSQHAHGNVSSIMQYFRRCGHFSATRR